MDLENVCRVCLKHETLLLGTSCSYKSTTYNELLRSCVPEIDWTCNVPISLICVKCIEQLRIVLQFRCLCLKSNEARTDFVNQKRVVGKPRIEEALLCDSSNSDLKEEPQGSLQEVALEDKKLDHDAIPRRFSCPKCLRSFRLAKNLDKHLTNVQCDAKTVLEDEARFPKTVDTEGVENGRLGGEMRDTTEINGRQGFFALDSEKTLPEDAVSKPDRRERVCKLCNNSFSKYAALLNHIRNIHTQEKCFKCELCGEGFTNLEMLKRHKNRHTGERKYVCSYCGKKFFTSSDLNHHVQRHLNQRSYRCNVCENKSFNTANGLRTHRIVVHSNPEEWKYLCTICGRKCVTQTALNVHMKRHSNTREFQCHICNKRFCTKAEVNKHVPSHSNLRMFKCPVCGQEYKDKKIMERHMVKKHGLGDAKIGERAKKHFCGVCPKKFVSKQQLEKHLRSHTGSRPFKCHLCEQTFICKSYIKGHMSAKHLINTGCE